MENNPWINNLINAEDALPVEPEPEIKLTQEDIAEFDKVTNELVTLVNPNNGKTEIKYDGGKLKRVVHTPFSTISSDRTWSNMKGKKFLTYINKKFKTVDSFNSWCATERSVQVYDPKHEAYLTFKDDYDFNLVFTVNEFGNMEAYARESRDYCKVSFICDMNDITAKKKLFNHLKLIIRLQKLRHIDSEAKVYAALINDISCGNFIYKFKPVNFTNQPNVWTFAYVPLYFRERRPTPAWDDFIKQIKTKQMQIEFCKWIYGIFVDNDFDRRVLWIQGENQTGKTTVINVVSDYLERFGKNLVGTITQSTYDNPYSLAGFDKARLCIYADVYEDKFFQRRDIMNLTGQDKVNIQQKFKDSTTQKIYVRIAVTSNYPPKINTTRGHETSRLLHIILDKHKSEEVKRDRTMGDVEYRKALLYELPYFLAKSRDYYEPR